tara:strand:+ start:351 stop:710 length:360 start_codon:yes stop_codon:yes gene_type:complete
MAIISTGIIRGPRTGLINLTPHDLEIHTPSGVLLVVRSGFVARFDDEIVKEEEILGIPMTSVRAGEIVGIGKAWPGKVLITSRSIAAHLRRPDVVSPGPLIRDEEGRVIGCRGLRRHVE